jgi:hypothetical protein
MKEDPPRETGKELQMSVSIEQKAAEGSTSSNSLKDIMPPSLSTGGGQCREGGKSKDFSIEHLSHTERKSSHKDGQAG